jgi:uncharacterized cofD-like protein
MEFIVTTIGGGTGSFNVLSGLRDHPNIHIQSIVSMMDSGGDSGRLRDEFGVLPPGDIRRCLVALSEETQIMRELFSYRFTEPPLQGRSFGNLFFLGLTKSLGSQQLSLEALSKILKIRGQVIAVTWDDVHIYARLADGSILKGEANIDVPAHDPTIPIVELYLEPRAKSSIQAIEAINNADFILLAPGDLYTSSIPNLLVEGISEAIRASNAPLIYVLNLMTKLGETNGYSASRHVEEIVKYGGRVPDAVLVHKGTIPENLAQKYKLEHAHEVVIDAENLYKLGVKYIKFSNIMSSQSLVRHDPERVGKALVDLFNELSVGTTDKKQTQWETRP